MSSLDDLSRHLKKLERKAATLPREVAAAVAPLLAENIRTVMGDNMKLVDLAEATQTERLREGFTANDPLVRSGELRDSVKGEVVDVSDAALAVAGSEDPVSGYLEFGTPTVPPRPSFEIGLAETELVARKIAENAAIRLLRDS